MNDDEERLESLSARLKERQMAEKFKIQDIENKLEQAEAMTLRLLDSSHGETDSIEEVRVIAETCVTVLAECVQVLGVNDVKITATFSDGNVPKSKLLQ
ncbi:hypothetical protein RYA05_25085 [Pseudomonas syringae pv. actinidiae]|uniref:Glutamate dehydrogenase/leucine dehydrogenase n=1 Tax=Pseudomonas syringae pv. actinidiae TaxID=103796 RepID=A0AAN4Q016_PSESF|nr:hypothetical protein [Pseudomonas syringae]EPN56823.1 hypothetical protein A235_33807 [Pseudomonas syringae pv. actinidiae ICMP 19079]EPN85912.1 hypothetical protein A234_04552 [Pseudomonas syringae pv. actinidiae ICMP 19101]AKT28194.1 hypothetical protein IYO_001470 [Pseudomonas syringae pv. actinidiae ICMP 18884]AOE54753.1 hypothetical protein NZ708_01470 [Pseudomonas syringae pv. actinidiae ICMP 18708]APP95616.1 hypothetical protein PsaNZ45_01470 [Pseudomonas syringae pv. actinidiae]